MFCACLGEEVSDDAECKVDPCPCDGPISSWAMGAGHNESHLVCAMSEELDEHLARY